jgi:hypothetical protein
MFGPLKKSLVSWCDEHGFGILCILSPDGECFLVVPSPPAAAPALEGIPPLRGMSEAGLRAHLTEAGLSDPDIDEAVRLSREWATTISGPGSVLWPFSDSN